MEEFLKNKILSKERWISNYITQDFLDKDVIKTKTGLKFALQISGGLRHFKFVIPWINKFIIEPLNADVFIHGWSNNYGVEENLTHINKYLNLKSFKINDFKNSKYDFLKKENKDLEKVYGNFFNINECNKLRCEYETKNNIIYDFIIRCRADAFFISEIEDGDILEIYNSNSIGIPIDYFSSWCPFITDSFAIGNRNVINEYCQSFHTIEECFINRSIGPEALIDYHINKYNLKVRNILTNFVIDYLPFLDLIELNKCNTRFNTLTKDLEWKSVISDDIQR